MQMLTKLHEPVGQVQFVVFEKFMMLSAGIRNVVFYCRLMKGAPFSLEGSAYCTCIRKGCPFD